MTSDTAVANRGEVLGLAAPFVAVAAVLALFGRPTGAALALGAAVVAANLTAFRPTVPAHARRMRARLVHLVGTGLAVTLGGAIFVVLFIPAWAFRRLRPARWQRVHGWTPSGRAASAAAGSRRSYTPAAPVPDAATHRSRLVLAGIGAVVVLLLADVGAGLLWERAFDRRTVAPVGQDDESLGVARSTVRDARVDTPAMAGASWRSAYFAELRSTRYTYWPYLLARPTSFRGTYINLDGWERRSWEPPGSSSRRPSVWLLGGSVVWGEGQRDLHTIASEVARLAAADDLPIQARNFGQPGWVSYQEVTLFDQLLIDRRQQKPDVAVFVDGVNDVAAQAQELPGADRTAGLAVPIHLGLEQVVQTAKASSGAAPSHVGSAPDPIRSTWDAYLRHSLAARAVRRVRGPVASEPTAARPSSGCGQGCPTVARVSDVGPAMIDRAVSVYRGNRAMARAIARRHGVVTHHFWQPTGSDIDGYRAAATDVGSPTVDLTAVLDGHRGDFLDPANLNEDGAHRMAVAIYARLRPDLVRWYAAHR